MDFFLHHRHPHYHIGVITKITFLILILTLISFVWQTRPSDVRQHLKWSSQSRPPSSIVRRLALNPTGLEIVKGISSGTARRPLRTKLTKAHLTPQLHKINHGHFHHHPPHQIEWEKVIRVALPNRSLVLINTNNTQHMVTSSHLKMWWLHFFPFEFFIDFRAPTFRQKMGNKRIPQRDFWNLLL